MLPVESVFASLYERGHSPLPITRRLYSDDPPSFGKAPGTHGIDHKTGDSRWFLLPEWNKLCAERETIHRVRWWGRMADRNGGGLGVACGYAGLIGIDIDNEALIEPLKAVLPTIVVAKRGRKGLTAFYRGEHPRTDKAWWQKKNYQGFLDFLGDGSQSVLPPSIHPGTEKPYEWTTTRTLLDTSVSELSAFTNDNLVAIEEVLRQHGWSAPEPTQRQSTAVARSHRTANTPSDADFDQACVAGRHAYLPHLGLAKLRRVPGGWRSVASFRQSSSGKAEQKRDLSLSIRDDGPIYDHVTKQGFNDITLVATCRRIDNSDAVAWLRETLNISSSSAEPTHSDGRISLEEAAASLEELMTEFDQAVETSIAIRNRERLTPSLILPRYPILRVRSEAGVGKSAIAVARCAAQAKRGRHMVYVVPDHKLAAQVAADFHAHDVKAAVYRGYEQIDPAYPAHSMCRNITAYKGAIALGVSVRSEICERRIDAEVVRCPFYADCGMQRQRALTPQVWIITSALLFLKRPDFMVEPDGIVIDESFVGGAIGETVEIDIDALLRSSPDVCGPDAETVRLWRDRLSAAVRNNGNGPLKRASLLQREMTTEGASHVGFLEKLRLFAHRLRPDMSDAEIMAATQLHSKANALAHAAATLWQEIGTFLGEGDHPDFYGDRSLSGRMTVSGNKIAVTPLRFVHQDWRDCPTLILDATAPPPGLLATVMGEIDFLPHAPVVTSKPDVAAQWSEHVYVRQILHANVSMGKLGLAGEPKPHNVKAILRYIEQRAAFAAPAQVGLITYKGLLEKIANQLPSNVTETLHFGNLAGMNNMQRVAGLIVVGRPRPPKAIIESDASVIAGHPVVTETPYYARKTAGIQLADGSVVSVVAERHPHSVAEAIRWRETDGELEQAIGRLRPHRRSEPCWLDIVSDVALPITVHKTVTWDTVEQEGPAPGLRLANWRHAVDLLGLSERDAKLVAKGLSLGTNSLDDSKESVPNERWRKVIYRHEGPKTKSNTAFLSPDFDGGEPALRRILERRAPLAKLEIEHNASFCPPTDTC